MHKTWINYNNFTRKPSHLGTKKTTKLGYISNAAVNFRHCIILFCIVFTRFLVRYNNEKLKLNLKTTNELILQDSSQNKIDFG